MEQDCDTWPGKKRLARERVKRVELTRLDLGTGWTGKEARAKESNVILDPLDLDF